MAETCEGRAAWLYRGGFSSVADAEAHLRPMADAGLNMVFTGAGSPEAAHLIEAAHQLGMEFHANASGVGLPEGRTDLKMMMPAGFVSYAGDTGGCPSNPEVRQHNIEGIADMLRRSPDVDGVHLDWIGFASDTYHGTVSLSYCYCPRCREGFRARHGVDPRELARDTEAAGEMWQEWVRYRCGTVNAYGAEIRAAIKGVREDLLLSATAHMSDGAPDILAEPYVCSPNFQEWGRWMAEGIVDFFCPMPYTVDNSSFRRMLGLIRRAEDTAAGRSFAYAGIGVCYVIDAAQLRVQIELCREHGVGGFSLFHAGSAVGGEDALWSTVAELCPEPATPPHRAAQS